MSGMMQPQIILLTEGTDMLSNISACTAVADTVRTTLGHDDKGTTISNDGATIIRLLDTIHPAAKILVDIAKSQDSEVGDGTAAMVLLAEELMKEAKPYVKDGVHLHSLVSSYRMAGDMAIQRVKELAVSIEEKKTLLVKCAATTLSSKLIGMEKEFFSTMVVDAVLAIRHDDRLNLIGIKKVPGGTTRDSFLVIGVAFKTTFSHAGFEQQPKKFLNPKILLLNIELELKSEKEEIGLSDPLQYQSIVDAERNKLDKCVQSGAKIVLSRLAIGDLATQYFADRGIFCAGHVTEEDLKCVSSASGGTVLTSVNNVIDEVLGTCEVFEEKLVGNEMLNIFSGCPSGQTATIVLRGGDDQFIEEAERGLHDAIMIVRRAVKKSTVVPGGGAIDMEISKYLRQKAQMITKESPNFVNLFAKALEVIPRQLCDNAEFDTTDVLNKLREKHASGDGANYGVDINTGRIADSFANFVWEPAVVKTNAIDAATKAACLILSVDETVKNPKEKDHTAAGVPDLTEDLWSDILQRLDAPAIYYCKGLSRTWRNIIRLPAFVASFRARALKTPNLLFLTTSIDEYINVNGSLGCRTHLYGLDGRCLLRSDQVFPPDSDSGVPEMHNDPDDLSVGNQAYYIHDSCDGMLIIAMHNKLIVYNPYIRRWGHLSQLGKATTICAFYARGGENREYMILYRTSKATMIYSLNSNEHRVVHQDTQIGNIALTEAISTAGYPRVKYEHWICWFIGFPRSILFFDTETEQFEVLPTPHVPDELEVFQILTVHGRLAIAMYKSNPANRNLTAEEWANGWPVSSIQVSLLEDKAANLWVNHLDIQQPDKKFLDDNEYLGDLDHDVLFGFNAETILVPCYNQLLFCDLEWSITRKLMPQSRVIPLSMFIEEGFEYHSWLDFDEREFSLDWLKTSLLFDTDDSQDSEENSGDNDGGEDGTDGDHSGDNDGDEDGTDEDIW